MQHKNVADAFDLLLGEVAAALEAIREEGAQAFRRGDSRMVRTLTARAEAVGGFLADLRARQKEWKRLISVVRRRPDRRPNEWLGARAHRSGPIECRSCAPWSPWAARAAPETPSQGSTQR